MNDVLSITSTCRHVIALQTKIRELERSTVLDLEAHIADTDGRTPPYLHRLHRLLVESLKLLGGGDSEAESDLIRLASGFQVVAFEFGFARPMDDVDDVGDASQKLSSLASKLEDIERCGTNNGELFQKLSNILSIIGDLQQALSADLIGRLGPQLTSLIERLDHRHAIASLACFRSDSKTVLQYLAGHHLLRQPFVAIICSSTSREDAIDRHVIHPETRGWILERIARWVTTGQSTTKRVYCVLGKRGSGKTALASTVCKLFRRRVIASHFFSEEDGPTCHSNTVNGLVRSLASELLRTVPDYLNYLDDRFENEEDLASKLNESWRCCYELLLREPLKALFGSKTIADRKLFVVDGLDECIQSEWDDLRAFVDSFVSDFSHLSLFVTIRSRSSAAIFPSNCVEKLEGLCFEDRTWINRHIRDVEIYLAAAVGAILSVNEANESYAKMDDMTLQKSLDELTKNSAGRFKYAVQLTRSLLEEMTSTNQFLTSMKKSILSQTGSGGNVFERRTSDFASSFRGYRDKEGRTGLVWKQNTLYW